MKLDTPWHGMDFVTAVEATRPLAYYRLEHTSGKSRDGSTLYMASGGVVSATPGAPLDVAHNRCVKLDGRDGYIRTTQVGGAATAASLMAWVEIADLPSQAHHPFYVMGESRDGGDLSIRFEGSDALAFNTGKGEPLTYKPATTGLADHWHLIVATMDAVSKARVLYWDGEQVANDGKGGEANNAGALSIGGAADAADAFFQGGIEEAALWNRALDADEVSAIFAASKSAAN